MSWLKSKEEKELERKIKANEGKRRIERHIQKQKKNIEKYWGLAKRAARLKDEKVFEQIAAFILATQRDVNRWERSLLYFDMVAARRDQVEASAQFANAYAAMAKSMLENSNPANVAKIQLDVERAMMRAEAMDSMMDDFMDMSVGLLDEATGYDQSAELRQIMNALKTEAEQEAESVDDTEIEASLRAIEEQLKRG